MAFFGMGHPFGFQPMLKEGHKLLSGLDEAVLKNIEACKQLSQIARTSLGPNGMNKIVINHLEKLFVTSDAGTIMNELEVQHPAAKLLVLASKSQQEEVGDGANLVVTLAGELLSGAEELIQSGLHPSEVIAGYKKAASKSLEILEQIIEKGSEKLDVRNKDEVVKRVLATVGSKLYGLESVFTPLIVEACIQVCPSNPQNFNVDNVRAIKLVGGGINDCTVVRGMVTKRDTEGTIKQASKAKIVVYGVGVDTTATETKGTVLIESADQLENYARTEEDNVEEVIKGIAAAGAKVVVSGSTVGSMALHFCERYKLMVIKMSSKFELRRLCRTTGAVAMVKFEPPTADVLGYVDSLAVEEIGGESVIVIKNESSGNLLSTIVLRGSTDNILDEAERAVDDGVNTYKSLCRDPRVVPGAGAAEIEIAKRLKEFGRKETGLDQYAIEKFGDTLEVVPRTLAENAGLNATAIISALYAAHAAGNVNVGVDIEGGGVKDMTKENIWDLYVTKHWALQFAADAVKTVLRVDQIVMAKIAGGPKPRQNPGGMDPDE